MNRPRSRHAAVANRTQIEDIRSRLAAIVDSSNDAIISMTLDGVILTWNPGAQVLFGYSEAEAIGEPTTIVIPPPSCTTTRGTS
jgi:PAS domain S-box-containing protein